MIQQQSAVSLLSSLSLGLIAMGVPSVVPGFCLWLVSLFPHFQAGKYSLFSAALYDCG
jgi:hypothetical protein